MSQDVTIEKGHPRGLMTLFFSEMWERVCYYGMRVLLTLYLIKSLLKGDAEAYLIYGAYTGLIYAAPILGGRMADKYLGYRLAIILGAILMCIGEFLILGGNEHMLLIGMGALIVGNGYFKANISTIVGKLYKDNDPRRDSGFTIFYIGINIGALIATTLVAYIGEVYGFHYGFALAGLGMLAALAIFWMGRENYSAAEGLNMTEAGKKKLIGPFNHIQVIVVASLILIPVCYFLIMHNDYLKWLFLALFVYIVYSLINAGVKEDKEKNENVWKDRMISLNIFIVINIVFWACFEQAGTSLTLFADRNVDRLIFGWEMPASMTQFFNPFFIIVFGSVFSVMWIKLSKMGKNPSIPMKFAFGIFQLGLGFLVTYIGYQFAEDFLVPILTIVFLYMLHTTGELFLSPIGLSMVTKLSPKKMAGTAMGAWFLSFAIGNLLAGQIATLTGGGHGGGESKEKTEFSFSTNVEEALKMAGQSDQFAQWESFYVIPKSGIDVPFRFRKDIEISKNISYQKWYDIQDWIYTRKAIESNTSFEAWKQNRPTNDTLVKAEAWIDANWNALRSDYKSIIENDVKNGFDKSFSMADWGYFKGNIENLETSGNINEAIDQQIDIVQESRLNNYTDIFTKIGLVLIVISVVIAAFNKPIKKLMHGVE